MNPLAEELNRQLQENNPHVFEMLSSLGKRLFFPKGILSQSAEAKQKAHRYNATIGIAMEKGVPMHLNCIREQMPGSEPADLFPYAPAAGKPALREAWVRKHLRDHPGMRGKNFGKPIVTHALTHGLSLVGDLFVDPGDTILLPDKFWGNYRLIFEVRKGGRIQTYPFYGAHGGFDVESLNKALDQNAGESKKVLVVLNFPNNPCGYSITAREADRIIQLLLDKARQGTRIVTVLDEAYFGLFYTEGLRTESLFGHLVNQDERLLIVKLDGSTKEHFVWGFRVGMLTYGTHTRGDIDAVYSALEKKTMGAIRGNISNCCHPSQTMILKAMESPHFLPECEQKKALLKARALKVLDVLKKKEYREAWSVYPFNSGYFMCLNVHGVDGEALRRHLLDRYGVGVIAAGGSDIRVAFSCIEVEQVEELFEIIYQGVMDLRNAA